MTLHHQHIMAVGINSICMSIGHLEIVWGDQSEKKRKSLPTKIWNLWFVSPKIETYMLHSLFLITRDMNYCLLHALHLWMEIRYPPIFDFIIIKFSNYWSQICGEWFQNILELKTLKFSGRTQHKKADYNKSPLAHKFPSCLVPRWSHGGEQIPGTSVPSMHCR